MVSLTRVKEATEEFIKVLRFGKSDVVTADQYLPHGIDSKPVKDKMAVYIKTGDKGEPIIIGYLANSNKTKEGEFRAYSTDSNGVEKTAIYLTNNGVIEMGGNSDNMVRFSKLKEPYDKTKEVLDAILTTLQTPINEPGNGAPSAFQAAMISAVGEKETGDISESKIDEIKTL